MIKQIFLITAFVLICISMFLPFQEFKSMWAEFEATLDGFVELNVPGNPVNRGYELLLPVLSVLLVGVAVFFSGFSKSQSASVVGLVFTSMNLLFVLLIYIPLITPATPEPFSLSRPPEPMIGPGYFLLLAGSFALFVSSVITIRRDQRS